MAARECRTKRVCQSRSRSEVVSGEHSKREGWTRETRTMSMRSTPRPVDQSTLIERGHRRMKRKRREEMRLCGGDARGKTSTSDEKYGRTRALACTPVSCPHVSSLLRNTGWGGLARGSRERRKEGIAKPKREIERERRGFDTRGEERSGERRQQRTDPGETSVRAVTRIVRR